MQTDHILSAPLIDLIFEGHNKAYGAYELRKNYSNRINKALLITMVIAAFICGGSILANSSKKSNPKYEMGPVVELTPFEDKKIEPEPKPEKQPEIKPPKTFIFTAPVITEVVDTPLPTQEDMDSAKIGAKKIDGPPADSGDG